MTASTVESEKAMATHSSTLAWKIPWTEEPGRLQSMGSWRVGRDWAISLSLFTFMHWRRKWQPTPVFLSGESQGWGSLVGCCLWGRTDWSDLAAAAVVQLNVTGLIQQRHLEFYPFVKLCKSKGTIAFIPSMQMLTQWKGQIIIFIIIQYIKIALILWTLWKYVRVPGICKLHLENYRSKLSFFYWIMMSFVSKHYVKCLHFHSLDLFMNSNLIFTLVSHIRVIYFVSLQKHTVFSK